MRCCINVLNAIDHSNLFDLFMQIVVFRLFAGEFELFVLKFTSFLYLLRVMTICTSPQQTNLLVQLSLEEVLEMV